jgi:alpha-L-fucosidase
VLTEAGRYLRETFKTNLAYGAKATASATRGRDFRASNALDGNTDTCWMPPDWTTEAELIITLAGEKNFNTVMFQEQIRGFGQRIAKFALDVQAGSDWKQVAEGQTVGYKRICRFDAVKAKKLRIRILDSRVCPTIANIGVYKAPPIR